LIQDHENGYLKKQILSVILILSAPGLAATPFRTWQFVITMSKNKQLVLNEGHLLACAESYALGEYM